MSFFSDRHRRQVPPLSNGSTVALSSTSSALATKMAKHVNLIVTSLNSTARTQMCADQCTHTWRDQHFCASHPCQQLHLSEYGQRFDKPTSCSISIPPWLSLRFPHITRNHFQHWTTSSFHLTHLIHLSIFPSLSERDLSG